MKEKVFCASLFDLDGVVFDTERQYSLFWGTQCRLYHPNKHGLEHVIKGQTLEQIFDKYFSGLESEQLRIIKRLDEFERNMKFEYVDGVLDFISSLRKNGILTAVVTSSNMMKMNAVYSAHKEFKSLFDIILTSEDFERSKPDPDCYIKGAERFDIPCEKCIVFEDSFNGLKSGRGAGMKVIGLSTTNQAETIKSYSDYVIPDFKGLDYQKICDILSSLI